MNQQQIADFSAELIMKYYDNDYSVRLNLDATQNPETDINISKCNDAVNTRLGDSYV